MHEDFWQNRWSRNQIGFHLGDVNPCLIEHAGPLLTASKVLVPLCGKSLDMRWLAGQGIAVMGVELAEKAVVDFFAEQRLHPDIRQEGAFRIYQAGLIELWCGDFFQLSALQLRGCDGYYDRAALIALPPAMREHYTAHLTRVLAPGCSGLLITLEYPQAQREGPPFAVLEEEVRALYGAGWALECLRREDVLRRDWRYLEPAPAYLNEVVYRVRRVGADQGS